MSLYLIVLAILCIAALCEKAGIKKYNLLYSLLFTALALMLCLRYGQGTDYLAYKHMYVNLPAFESLREAANTKSHGEAGWKLICSICNHTLNMSFELFIVIISVVEMYGLSRFIKNYCPKKILALLIFYPTFFLTYYFSAFRQGLVLAVFLGFLLDYCMQKKYLKYYTITILLSAIHTAALILLIVPLVHSFRIGLKQSIMIVVGCFFLGCLVGFTGLKSLLPYSTSSYSLIAIAERVVSFIVVIVICAPIYNELRREDSHNVYVIITDIYILGMMLYGICFSSDLLAARIIVFFKCMELILFGLAASYNTIGGRQITYTYSIVLAIVMTAKNIGAYIQQLGYVYGVTVINYPYVSILHPEKIAEYANSYFVNYFH